MSYPSFGPASPQPLFQDNWRYCNNCHVLFYDGYPNKGVCPAGGGHVLAGYNFSLVYDSPQTGQPDWRYCNNCHALFYDGYPNKGVCPAGGGHVAIGDNFDIPYDPSPVR